MNREEAKVCIDAIIGTWEKCQNQKYLSAVDVEIDVEDIVALKMAITALSQEQQSEWERDHEVLKAYADGQESMKDDRRNIEEIAEVMKCDADADTKCRMISNILNAKPHYFKSQEPCGDAISRQDVVKAVDKHTNDDGTLDDDITCILEDVPSVTPQPCEDAISRADVLDLCESKDPNYAVIHFKEDVECLPPVSVTEKTGRWEKAHDGYSYWYKCSCCGEKIPKNDFGSDYFSPYCPECGAKMEVEE